MTVAAYYGEQPQEVRDEAEKRLQFFFAAIHKGTATPHGLCSAKMEALWNCLGLPKRINSDWKPIEEYRRGKDPLHIIGYHRDWGVAEFIRHDDGWTISSFNGGVKRVAPTHWQPLPSNPVT